MRLKRKICSFLFLLFLFNPLEVFISKLRSDELSLTDQSHKTDLNFDNTYLLGPGDHLQIIFFGAEEFSGEYKILKDGFIYLPIVGSIYLSGLSIDESSKKIQTKYTNELLRPQVQINILTTRSIQVSLLGEVKRQGIYKINTANPEENNFSRVTDAIQKAGGITEDANIKEVEVIRKSGNSDYPLVKTTIDLHSLITKGDTSQNLILFDGDVIKIPKAESNISLDIIANSNINNSSIKVYVIGEVKNPGELTLNSNTTLIDAVLNAGGPIRWRGNEGNVRFIRFEKNGKLTAKKIKLNFNQNAINKDNPMLIEGDVIEIKPTALATVSDGLELVAKPFTPLINIFTLGKIIND